jgi:hypothetical protein
LGPSFAFSKTLPVLRIDADFLRHFTALNVERVAQTTAAFFFL